MNPTEQPPPCLGQSDRWLEHPDSEAVWMCRRRCPRRIACARDAYETPDSFGLWAGVVIPRKDGRGRIHAFVKLASIGGITEPHPQAVKHRFSYSHLMGGRTA